MKKTLIILNILLSASGYGASMSSYQFAISPLDNQHKKSLRVVKQQSITSQQYDSFPSLESYKQRTNKQQRKQQKQLKNKEKQKLEEEERKLQEQNNEALFSALDKGDLETADKLYDAGARIRDFLEKNPDLLWDLYDKSVPSYSEKNKEENLFITSAPFAHKAHVYGCYAADQSFMLNTSYDDSVILSEKNPYDTEQKYPEKREGLAKKYYDLLEWLIDKGADVNKQREDGMTLLHKAAEIGDVEFVKTLISHGANCDIQEGHGMSPSDVALLEARMEEDEQTKAKFREIAQLIEEQPFMTKVLNFFGYKRSALR